MAINYDVWGAESTWVKDTATSQAKADIYTAAATQDTYQELYNLGKIELNTIDKSAYFYAIGKDCIWCNPCYISPWWDTDSSSVKADVREVKASRSEDPIYFCNANVSSENVSYSRRYAPFVTSTPSANAYATSITLKFNYKKVLAIPRIFCVADSFTTGAPHESTFDNYFSTDYSSYPRIVGIGYLIRCGAGGDDKRTSTTTRRFVPIFERKYYHIDANYYDNQFWARNDFSIMTNGISEICPQDIYLTSSRVDQTVATADTGFRARYCVTNDTNSVPIYYFDPEDSIWMINTDTHVSSGKTYCNPYPYIAVTAQNLNDVRAYVLKQIAYLGLPFSDTSDATITRDNAIGDEHICLPVFDEHGITTGEYKTGAAALTLPNADWNDSREGADYKPGIIPDKDSGDLTNTRPARIINAGGLEMFVMTYTEVESFERYITGNYSPTEVAFIEDFKGTNPQDYIVSVQKYPFDLPTAGTPTSIYVGKIDTNKTALAFNSADQSNCYLDFGTISFVTDIVPYYDFRDYDSKIVLLLPFIGSVDLDPRLYMGHELGLIYNIDYYSGHVTAEIKRDGLTVDTKTNTLSITIPFFAGNMGQYQNSLAQTQLAIEQSKIKQITGAVTTLASIGGVAASMGAGSTLGGLGSAGGIVRGASNMILERINQESLEYTLTHTQPNVGSISTASPGNAMLMDDRARVLFWRPYMIEAYESKATDSRLSGAQLYAATVGNACAIPGYLSDFSGFTVAASAELAQIYTIDGTKAATEQELQMIRAQLLKGVYI